MKKTLLFILLVSFISIGYSQSQKNTSLLKKSKDMNVGIQNNLPAPVLNLNSTKADVNRIPFATAADFRTVRREDTRAISYNAELDVIAVTMILDPATYGTNATDVGMFYSTDMGQTWEGPVVIVDNGEDFVNDYPSGIIYNPTGNTEIEDAYGVMQNISHVGGDWGYKMWSSMTLGGENNAIEVSHNPDNIEDGYWNQYGLSQIIEEVRCMNMLPQGDWNAYTSAELQPIYGEFEGTEFDWDDSDLIEVDLYQNSDDDIMAWIGGYRGFDGGLDMAWSDNGQTGYMYMIGSTNDHETGYQPIVYKTTNGGDDWDLIELDFFTDEMQEFLEPYIIEATGGLMIPQFFESACGVDLYGDLQIFAAVGSHSADVTVHRDSIGYAWQYPGDLFSLTIDDDGIKNIMWIDSLNTDNMDDEDEGSYAGNGWNHRLSVAKNYENDQFFLTWIDTRNVDDFEINAQPDLFGWSKMVSQGLKSDVKCFTEGTLYETFYFFTYGAERAIYDEAYYIYTVPHITVVSPTEFSSNSATDPVTFSYVTGIEFDVLWSGVNDLEQQASFTVKQNQPNPFGGSTTIEVNTQRASQVSVEVSNLMGQSLYTVDAGVISGVQNIQLSAENLSTGVYFYTIKVGEESITKKMIVE